MRILTAAVLAVLAGLAGAQVPADQPAEAATAAPIEYGLVPWLRTERWDEAAAAARDRGCPLLVLFQEVPG